MKTQLITMLAVAMMAAGFGSASAQQEFLVRRTHLKTRKSDLKGLIVEGHPNFELARQIVLRSF